MLGRLSTTMISGSLTCAVIMRAVDTAAVGVVAGLSDGAHNKAANDYAGNRVTEIACVGSICGSGNDGVPPSGGPG